MQWNITLTRDEDGIIHLCLLQDPVKFAQQVCSIPPEKAVEETVGLVVDERVLSPLKQNAAQPQKRRKRTQILRGQARVFEPQFMKFCPL